MNCPNCRIPFALESNGKFHCVTCGKWLENVGDPDPEWLVCEAPEPAQSPEPDPAALEPDPAILEPGPDPESGPAPQVKKYLGGIITVTEFDE